MLSLRILNENVKPFLGLESNTSGREGEDRGVCYELDGGAIFALFHQMTNACGLTDAVDFNNNNNN